MLHEIHSHDYNQLMSSSNLNWIANELLRRNRVLLFKATYLFYIKRIFHGHDGMIIFDIVKLQNYQIPKQIHFT